MNLNDLENKFFGRILNAELDVPVHSTLEYGENTFGIIVVPEISSKGISSINRGKGAKQLAKTRPGSVPWPALQ